MVINSNVWVEGYFSGQSLRQQVFQRQYIRNIYTSLSTIYWQMMVIHINDPPTQAGALHIIFLKLGQGIVKFYQFCAVKKFKGSV